MVNLDFDGINGEEDIQGYSPVQDGTYHLVVLEADDSLHKSDAVVLKFEVLAGTINGQVGKSFSGFFNMPSPSHKDGGQFCKRILARVVDVLDLAPRSVWGKPGVQIDFSLAVGRQLVAKVVCEADKNGKKRSHIDSMNFWKVTDAAAVEVPKDVNALALIGVVAGNGAATTSATATTNHTGQPAPAAPQPAQTVDPFAGV